MLTVISFSMKGKYHYEFFAYTDNLCYGRMLIGSGRTESEARREARMAGKGVFVIERHRVANR